MREHLAILALTGAFRTTNAKLEQCDTIKSLEMEKKLIE
jgi:hypothetical protein